jgi:hypothetical protein
MKSSIAELPLLHIRLGLESLDMRKCLLFLGSRRLQHGREAPAHSPGLDSSMAVARDCCRSAEGLHAHINEAVLSLGKIFPTMETWTYCLTTAPTDDYTIVIAWSFAVGQAVMAYLFSLKSWQGYHYYDIPPLSVEDRMQASKYDLANQLL